MTESRADEIIHRVIYGNLYTMPELNNSVDAFHIGRMIGKMQRQLEDELAKEVEPRKAGHWNTLETVQGGITEKWLTCSECGYSNALYIPRNYCPNCGAKMEV